MAVIVYNDSDYDIQIANNKAMRQAITIKPRSDVSLDWSIDEVYVTHPIETVMVNSKMLSHMGPSWVRIENEKEDNVNWRQLAGEE